MSIFPANPQIGDQFSGKVWNGTTWEVISIGQQISGVISATPPITYNTNNKIVGINQGGLTLAQSQVTSLVTDLAAKLATAGAMRKFASTYYYTSDTAGGSDGTTTLTQSRLLFLQFTAPNGVSIDRIGVEVTTGVASTTIRLGIYASTAGGLPGSLVTDYGTIDSSGTGAKEITISPAATLAAGTYWLAIVAQGGTPTVRSKGFSTNPYIGRAAIDNANPTCWNQDSVTGALPGTATPLNTQALLPKVMVRIA